MRHYRRSLIILAACLLTSIPLRMSVAQRAAAIDDLLRVLRSMSPAARAEAEATANATAKASHDLESLNSLNKLDGPNNERDLGTLRSNDHGAEDPSLVLRSYYEEVNAAAFPKAFDLLKTPLGRRVVVVSRFFEDARPQITADLLKAADQSARQEAAAIFERNASEAAQKSTSNVHVKILEGKVTFDSSFDMWGVEFAAGDIDLKAVAKFVAGSYIVCLAAIEATAETSKATKTNTPDEKIITKCIDGAFDLVKKGIVKAFLGDHIDAAAAQAAAEEGD